MANLVHNEKVKLRANFLNNVAVACIVVGVIAPVAAGGAGWWWAVGLGVGVFFAVMLNFFGQQQLTMLRE